MSSKKKTKTASQILLEQQQQIKELFQLCQDTNANVKALLNNINLQRRATAQAPLVPDVVPPREEMPAPPAKHPAAKENVKESMVEQAVVYQSNDRPVALANVEIFDVDSGPGGVRIKKTVTSSNGKWTASLPRGKYRVEIKKGPAQGNPGFIKREDFEIAGDGKPLIMERKIV